MIYRKLGRTGLDVGVVGLGAEYLEHEPANTVISVVHRAIDGGVNYIDLFMASPGVRDNFGKALRNRSADFNPPPGKSLGHERIRANTTISNGSRAVKYFVIKAKPANAPKPQKSQREYLFLTTRITNHKKSEAMSKVRLS